MPEDQNHWSIDKKIPLAIVLTLLAQFAFGVYWVAATSYRVAAVEEHALRTEQQTRELVKMVADIREGLAAIKGAIDATFRNTQSTNRAIIQTQPRQSTGGTSGSG